MVVRGGYTLTASEMAMRFAFAGGKEQALTAGRVAFRAAGLGRFAARITRRSPRCLAHALLSRHVGGREETDGYDYEFHFYPFEWSLGLVRECVLVKGK